MWCTVVCSTKDFNNSLSQTKTWKGNCRDAGFQILIWSHQKLTSSMYAEEKNSPYASPLWLCLSELCRSPDTHPAWPKSLGSDPDSTRCWCIDLPVQSSDTDRNRRSDRHRGPVLMFLAHRWGSMYCMAACIRSKLYSLCLFGRHNSFSWCKINKTSHATFHSFHRVLYLHDSFM